MSGKQFSLDSRMDLAIQGIEATSKVNNGAQQAIDESDEQSCQEGTKARQILVPLVLHPYLQLEIARKILEKVLFIEKLVENLLKSFFSFFPPTDYECKPTTSADLKSHHFMNVDVKSCQAHKCDVSKMRRNILLWKNA